MKKLPVSCIFLLISFYSFSQASNTWSVKFSDAIKTRYTPTINNMTGKGWEYSNTIITHGMEKVYNWVNDASYFNYIKAYVDLYVNSSGAISATINSLDRTHPGISVLFLYEKLKSTSSADSTKYRTAATTLRNIYVGASATYPKTAIGGIFWHKNNGSYNDIVMLDGIYMLHPFLAKYGSLFGDNAAIDTAVNQTLFLYNQLYDNTTKLIKHAWNPTKTQTWANATTGNSTSVWSRAMGWYMMALVDILKYVPASHPKRANLLTALSNLSMGIANYQDPSSKLWYQVVDKGSGLSGNYLETSGSAMFVYALKTGVDSGWLNSATYLPVAQSGWTGVQTKIDNYTDGKPRINDFAPAMSVQNTEALYVQASLQPVDVPVVSGTQHPHGYAAILMSASVMEFPLTILPVKFISFTAKEYPDKIRLSWQNGDESNVDLYEVQKSMNGSSFTVIGTVTATGLSTYVFDDNTIESKTVYYRINALYHNGAAHYSAVLPVRKSKTAPGFTITPNPVQDGALSVVMTNINPGAYNLKVVSSAGITIDARSIDINSDRNVVYTLWLPGSTGKGLYYVQLEGAGTKLLRTVLVK